jgi:hypothetical protein
MTDCYVQAGSRKAGLKGKYYEFPKVGFYSLIKGHCLAALRLHAALLARRSDRGRED